MSARSEPRPLSEVCLRAGGRQQGAHVSGLRVAPSLQFEIHA